MKKHTLTEKQFQKFDSDIAEIMSEVLPAIKARVEKLPQSYRQRADRCDYKLKETIQAAVRRAVWPVIVETDLLPDGSPGWEK